MTVVFLGFFETLGEILSGIFNAVLYPVLELLATTLFNLATVLLEDLFAVLWLTLLRVLLKLLDNLEYAFDLLAGSRYVLYYPNGVDGAKLFALEEGMTLVNDGNKILEAGERVSFKQTYLIDLFTTQGPVARVYWLVMIVGLALVFIFTIIGISRSMSSMALEDKHPIGKVMTQAGKACLIFLLVPFLTMALSRLSTVVVVAVERNLAGGDVSLSNVMFCMVSMGDTGTGSPEPSFEDSVRSDYLHGDRLWKDLDRIQRDFHIKKFDFLMGFIIIIALMIIMMFSIFVCVKRLFEAALLFLVSPLFISAMPLDEGRMFQKWLNAFIGRMFSALGSILAMKLLIIFAGVVTSPKLSFGAETGVDTIIRTFIILGGAYTAFKSQQTFLEIISPETAQSNQGIGAFMMGATVGNLAQAGGSALARGAGNLRAAGAASRGAAAQNLSSAKDTGNQFTGGGGGSGGGGGGRSGGGSGKLQGVS